MVLRDQSHVNPAAAVPFRLRIDGRWVLVDEKLLRAHPGGGAMLAYRNLDATNVFHAFHASSKRAYTWLRECRERNSSQSSGDEKEENLLNHAMMVQQLNAKELKEQEEQEQKLNLNMQQRLMRVNMGKFEMADEQNAKVCRSFAQLRYRVRELGLLNGDDTFFVRKFIEAIALISFSIFLQTVEFYILSALVMGLAWQQLGWMIHEYGHQQHFKNYFWNDICGYICGNLLQGFSLGGWKEQHNVHHAATNVDGRDGDLDLLPFWATIGSQLMSVDSKSFFARLLPFQHLYWAFALPLLRISWLIQSILFVLQMRTSFYDVHRERAILEQCTLAGHWTLVVAQYYFMPDNQVRILYFLISQLFAGFLLAHVVTYNHYSTEKFSYDDPILSNYACLQLYTTRNMRPGFFIDWLWGGLNYQIEHHLFPTMPRHNLKKVMPLVKEFCAENDLPYMVDDYFTGFWMTIEQFHNVAIIAADIFKSNGDISSGKTEVNAKQN